MTMHNVAMAILAAGRTFTEANGSKDGKSIDHAGERAAELRTESQGSVRNLTHPPAENSTENQTAEKNSEGGSVEISFGRGGE